MNDVQHSYLCDLLKQAKEVLKESNKENHVSNILNLMGCGLISKDDAMKDPIFNEYVSNMKLSSDKAKTKIVKWN